MSYWGGMEKLGSKKQGCTCEVQAPEESISPREMGLFGRVVHGTEAGNGGSKRCPGSSLQTPRCQNCLEYKSVWKPWK